MSITVTGTGPTSRRTFTFPDYDAKIATTKSPWVFDNSTGQTFNGTLDPMLLIGSNISVGSVRLDTSDAAIWLQVEHDYNDGTRRLFEVSINGVSTTGTTRRFYALTSRRDSPDTYTLHYFFIDPTNGRFRVADVTDPDNPAKLYHDFQPGQYVLAGSATPQITITANTGVAPSKSIRVSGSELQVVNNAYTTVILKLTDTGAFTVGGGITHGGTTLLTTTAALTNGAAAATGTLTNAPTAGNPTKWIPISDNGTTRYIPAW
jgi:hypothetical protein